MKPISQLTDARVASLTPDELVLAIREEAILQGITPPAEVFEVVGLGIAYALKSDAIRAATGAMLLSGGKSGFLTALTPDLSVAPRVIDAPVSPEYEKVRDAGLARFAQAQANDGLTKKQIAKRDAYLAAAGGDAVLAQKFWVVENPTTPWPA